MTTLNEKYPEKLQLIRDNIRITPYEDMENRGTVNIEIIPWTLINTIFEDDEQAHSEVVAKCNDYLVALHKIIHMDKILSQFRNNLADSRLMQEIKYTIERDIRQVSIKYSLDAEDYLKYLFDTFVIKDLPIHL